MDDENHSGISNDESSSKIIESKNYNEKPQKQNYPIEGGSRASEMHNKKPQKILDKFNEILDSLKDNNNKKHSTYELESEANVSNKHKKKSDKRDSSTNNEDNSKPRTSTKKHKHKKESDSEHISLSNSDDESSSKIVQSKNHMENPRNQNERSEGGSKASKTRSTKPRKIFDESNGNFVSSEEHKNKKHYKDDSESDANESHKHKKKSKKRESNSNSEDNIKHRKSSKKHKRKNESDSEQVKLSKSDKKQKDKEDSDTKHGKKHKKYYDDSDTDLGSEQFRSSKRGKKHKKQQDESESDKPKSHKKHKKIKEESISEKATSSKKKKKKKQADDNSDSDRKDSQKQKKKSKHKKHQNESSPDVHSPGRIEAKENESDSERNELLEKIIGNTGGFENLTGEELKFELDRQFEERQKRIENYLNFTPKKSNNLSMLSDDLDNEINAIQNEIKSIGDGYKQHELNVADYARENNKANLAGKRDYLTFRLTERENQIDALAYKCNMFSEKYEGLKQALLLVERSVIDKTKVKKFRGTLLKLREEIIEANAVIDKVQNMAHELLPGNVSKHCKKVDDTKKRLLELQDDLLEKKYFAKKKIVINEKETEALNIAIHGEIEVARLLEIRKKNEIQRLLFHRMRTKELNKVIARCNEELVMINLTLEEAQELTRRNTMATTLKNRKLQEKEEEEIKEHTRKEKIKELKEHNKMIKKEIELIKKQIKNIDLELEEMKVHHQCEKENIHLMEKLEAEGKRRRIMAEKLQTEKVLRKAYYNQVEDMKGAIRVFCRVRPISASESKHGNEVCFDFPDIYTVVAKSKYKKGKEKNKEYLFDHVFPMSSTQEEIFKEVDRLIEIVFTGFNVCVFAYGQTGSGKTFTLIGDMSDGPDMGIVPRSFKRIFELVEKNQKYVDVECKFFMLELYNDKLLDLMKAGAEYSEKLEIKKNEYGMVIVPGLTTCLAKSASDMVNYFHAANKNRHIASTKMNSESSRSHLILTVIFKFVEKAAQKKFFGKLSIIDLAGSERSAKSGVTGIHLTEATAINKALTSLGDVISALTQANKGFVPYRNHKLTQLMQDSLGGTAKTLMIVNLSPVDFNLLESLSSLNYATRVKTITNEGVRVGDENEVVILRQVLDKLVSGETVVIP